MQLYITLLPTYIRKLSLTQKTFYNLMHPSILLVQTIIFNT